VENWMINEVTAFWHMTPWSLVKVYE